MEKIEELQQIRRTIEQGGGADKIKKQHESGKKTARERLAMLFDEGSFVEIDAFVKHRCNEFNMPKTEAPVKALLPDTEPWTADWSTHTLRTLRLSVVLWVKCRRQKFAKLWTWQQKWVLLSSELTIPRRKNSGRY